MADFVYNIAKGRAIQYAINVDTSTPSTSRLVLIPINTTATDDALNNADDFGAVLATATTAERTTGGWNRKTLTAADVTMTLDDTANTYSFDIINDQTWTSVTANTVTDLVLCYDPVTPSANASLIPLIQFDFSITPDGSDIIAQFNVAGVLTAS